MSTTTNPAGRFVWHDLMTTNVEAAKVFYSELFGWTFKDVSMEGMGPGAYSLILVGDRDIGGIMPLQGAPGVPSHWVPYLTVASVDEATRQGQAQGAKVHVPPTDIPRVGRFAVVEDPQGGVFSPFTYGGTSPKADDGAPPPVSHFCWDELMSPSPAASAAFYTALTGWTVAEMDMGAMGTYRLCKRGERDAGGIFQADAGMPRAAWLSHVHVADVDGSAARAASLKGSVVVPPTDIPHVGRFAVVTDSTGATFGLFKGGA